MSDPQASLRPDEIVKGERFRKDLGDIDALAASIRANGLLHPVVVTSDHLLVAGERRLAAVRSLGWTRVPVRIIDPEDLLTAERDENAVRLDFRPSEAAAIAAALRPVEKAKAQERQGTRTDLLPEPLGHIPTSHAGRSEDRVAAAVGMSRKTLAKATEVVEAADAGVIPPAVVERMDETGNVEAAHRETRRLLEQASDAIGRDPEVAEARRAKELARAMKAEGLARMHLEPATWAEGLSADDLQAMRSHLVDAGLWIDRWQKALDRPALRVVGGDR